MRIEISGKYAWRTDLVSEMDVTSSAKDLEGELIRRTDTALSTGVCL